MPSFDVVSEVDLQEVRNATDQANREVGTRFDFKGSDASFSLDEGAVNLQAFIGIDAEIVRFQEMNSLPVGVGLLARIFHKHRSESA